LRVISNKHQHCYWVGFVSYQFYYLQPLYVPDTTTSKTNIRHFRKKGRCCCDRCAIDRGR
jgi:hypothetical protein